MPDHIWKPVEAEVSGAIQVVYRNELGEEHIHVTDYGELYTESRSPHVLCWSGCSGDWPGCRKDCFFIQARLESVASEHRELEFVPPVDSFRFMFNHIDYIDDHNCYVEAFDTPDGAHWEIAVDIDRQLLDKLDEETREDG